MDMFQKTHFYPVSVPKRPQALQDIRLFVQHQLTSCVQDSKARCLQELCRAIYAGSNLGKVRGVINQYLYANPSI